MPDDAAIVVTIVLLLALVGVAAYLLTRIAVIYRQGKGEVVVRCKDGHLFTTVWIPGVSFKAIRLGPNRFQYCPVGEHRAWVKPVNPNELNPAERRFAARHRDRPIP